MVPTVFLQQTENVGCVVGARSVGCVARHNARTPANFPCPALDLQLTGDHFVGKPSAVETVSIFIANLLAIFNDILLKILPILYAKTWDSLYCGRSPDVVRH